MWIRLGIGASIILLIIIIAVAAGGDSSDSSDSKVDYENMYFTFRGDVWINERATPYHYASMNKNMTCSDMYTDIER